MLVQVVQGADVTQHLFPASEVTEHTCLLVVELSGQLVFKKRSDVKLGEWVVKY